MGLLSKLLNDNSGKKAAGSVSDMEKRLASDSLITMDAARWITIHPNGEEDYRRIEIDDQTGEILKGGAMALQGTNIKDFGENMKNKKRVRGMSIKTVEEYQAKEKDLQNKLVEAGKARNRGDFGEALNIAETRVKGRGAKKVDLPDWYDFKNQHPEKYKEYQDFIEGTNKAERKDYDERHRKEQAENWAEEYKEMNKRRKERMEAAPLENEKMEKAVEVFNNNTTAKLQELKNKRDAFVKHFDRQKDLIIRKIGDDVQKLSDAELKDLSQKVGHLEAVGRNLQEEIDDFISESHNKFTALTKSKTRNKDRYSHYLKNLEHGTPLGDFAFGGHNVPDDVVTYGGNSVYNKLMHEEQRRWRLKNQ